MSKVIICMGLPGSGKSTWSKDFCEKNPTYVRVCRDDLRHMRGRYILPRQEKLITEFEHSCIHEALWSGLNVVVDATNLKEEYRNSIILIAKEFNAEVEIKSFMEVSLYDCIKRDLKRPNSVGEKVIVAFYDKYIREKTKVNIDYSLPHVIISDLDGTLALFNGRDPYDFQKCDTDSVNEPVQIIIENYLSYGQGSVIFLSGREDSCKDKTEAWIKKHIQLMDNEFILHMRKTGDHRNDCIVKKEIFMEHIDRKYYVEFVLDDRNSVVDMWRKDLGLTCLQTNYGDF